MAAITKENASKRAKLVLNFLQLGLVGPIRISRQFIVRRHVDAKEGIKLFNRGFLLSDLGTEVVKLVLQTRQIRCGNRAGVL